MLVRVGYAAPLPTAMEFQDSSQSKDEEEEEDQLESPIHPETHCDNADGLEDQGDNGTAPLEEKRDSNGHSDNERKSSFIVHLHYDDLLKLVGLSSLKLMKITTSAH